jgi:ATP-dependent helicase/nuclease subunit B
MSSPADTLLVLPAGVAPPTPSARVWTLEQLRDAIVPLSGRRTLRGPALQGLLAAASSSVGAGPFGGVAHSPGFLRGLESLLEALALGDVPPRALLEAAERLGSGTERLKWLGALVEACHGQMARAGVELAAQRWTVAATELARGWPAALPFGRLDLTVPPPCAPAVVAFLRMLAASAARAERGIVLRVPMVGEASVDAALEPLLQAFESGPDLEGVELLPELPPESCSLALPLRHLATSSPGSRPVESLRAFVAPGPRRESAELVHLLRKALEEGAPVESCGLVAMAPDGADELVRALDEAGLPVGRRPGVTLGQTVAGRVGLAWAGLAARRFPAETVAWLGHQRLLPRLRSLMPANAAGLLRQAGLRDASLGAGEGQDAYAVRLAALVARLRLSEESRTAARAERLAAAVAELRGRAAGLAGRAPLATHLEAWRAGLEAMGFWSALDEAPFDLGRAARRAAAREAAALEVWRAFVRDVRAGWKTAGQGGASVDATGFSRWLADAAQGLPVQLGRGAAAGVDVLLLDSVVGRRFAFLGFAGLDAASAGQQAEPSLLSEEERRAINDTLGRAALPGWVGAADVRLPVPEAVGAWRLGLALASAGRVAVGRRRSAGGAPADLVERLLVLTGGREVELGPDLLPPLEHAASIGWARTRLALEASVAPELRSTSVDPLASSAVSALGEAPWLVRARRLATAEAERLRVRAGFDAPGLHSGALGDPDLVDSVALRLGGAPEFPLSSTSLQHLANCPFQGLSRKVLRLEPPEEGGEELDARGRGQLLHRALELLVRKLRDQALLEVPPAQLPAGFVVEVVAEAAEEYAQRALTGHPRTWALAQARVRRTLERLLATGRLFPFRGLRPVATEVPFGRPEAEADWQELQLPGALSGERPVWFRGTVDRIDQGPGGTGVLDYKSSKRRDRAAAEFLVTDFQLPLYLYAVKRRGERGPLRAGWLSLRNLEFLPLDEAQTGPLELFLAVDAETRSKASGPNLATTVQQTLAEPRQGLFPVRPHDCGFCELGAVCRISERRAPARGEG